MSYTPSTDFLALFRSTPGGVRTERMPGLDYVVAALGRAGMFQISVSTTPPTSNQANTVWVLPASPTWSAECSVFLWNAFDSAYELATPALWRQLFAPIGYSFQSAAAVSNNIVAGTTLLAVQRAAPAATALVLPSLTAQWRTGRGLRIVDFSTNVANHVITVTPSDTATVMQKASWQLFSTADQLSGVELYPSPDLNSWVIAP